MFNDKRKIILMEWLDDAEKSSEVANMTPEQLDMALVDAIKVYESKEEE